MANAHPHCDCSGTIAVVHNGIIDNYQELRRDLSKSGHKFTSETDTETIPHLLEEETKRGCSLEAAVLAIGPKLEGSYTFLAVSSHDPDKIVGIRKGSPLAVGYVKEAGYVCARSGGHIQREPYDLEPMDTNARYHVGSIPITNQSLDEFKAIVSQASRYSVVSLCYHFISDTSPAETSTPVQNFRDQMRYLKEAGFTVVLLPDLIE